MAETIGFFITLFALLFFFFRKIISSNPSIRDPEEFHNKQKIKARQQKEFLRSLNINYNDDDDEEEETGQKFKPKKKQKKNNQQTVRTLDSTSFKPERQAQDRPVQFISVPYQQQEQIRFNPRKQEPKSPSKVTQRINLHPVKRTAYTIGENYQISRGRQLLKKMDYPQDMFILQAIIGQPKSLD